MSKKIIYLLSLLMALSLVFASCKKGADGITGLGGGPTQNETIDSPDNLTGGLFTDKAELEKFSSSPVQVSEVAQYRNGDYMRNPVITVVGGQTVVIFYERRYQTSGSANDVALTGNNAVSIAYMVSRNGGKSFETTSDITGYVGGESTSAADAHGAPVVFNTGTHIVVVASAGIGLSSGSGITGESKLQYSVAEIKSDAANDGTEGPSIGEFSGWQNMDAPTTAMGADYTQFGTHSARGTVYNGTLLLPVTLAKFTGGTKFGYVLYTGTVSGTSVNWTVGTTAVDMPATGGVVKETRIVKANSASDYVYLAVSSDTVRITQGTPNTTPTKTDIVGSDGSAGTLVVKDWRGASYDPVAYADAFDKGTAGTPKSILSHVLTLENNLAIRIVDDNFSAQVGNSFALGEAYATKSKSSSLDILKDGTIVMVAEGGLVEGADGRPFRIYFTKYTQAHLASATGNAAAN